MIYKFRTMRIDTPNVATHLLKNPEQYITPIGKFMRKTSLDELPQLFNILKGEMSVVGPRPALYNQYDLIEMRTKANVHIVRPGLTGLAQVSGRDELENEQKVYFDQMRKTSLDELPQLFNILKGEMSVVGPRPALYNQYDLIEMRTKANVHTVRPGLTGLAQVSGRDELENEQKVYFDQQYVQKQTFFFDLKLIFLTVVKVFKSEGVVEGSQNLDEKSGE